MEDRRKVAPDQDIVGAVYDFVLGPGTTAGPVKEPVYRHGHGPGRPAHPRGGEEAPHPRPPHPGRRWNDAAGRRPPADLAITHPGRRWNDVPPPSRHRFASVAGNVGFFVDGGRSPAQGDVARTLERRAREGPDAAPGKAPELLSHWERADRIRRHIERLEHLAAIGQGILHRLDTPLLATDGETQIRFANATATSVLERGSPLRSVAGRLATTLPERQVELQVAVLNASRFGTLSELALADRGDDRRWWILVAPLASAPAPAPPVPGMAMLLLHAVDGRPAPPNAFLQATYGVSAAESRVAEALARGQTPEDYAIAAGLSLNTVRTQIRGLLTKTGLRRQADLLALLSRLPTLHGFSGAL